MRTITRRSILEYSVLGSTALLGSAVTLRAYAVQRTRGAIAQTTVEKVRGTNVDGIHIFTRIPYGASTAGPGIVPINGASNPDHVIESGMADRLNLGREEWYGLLSTPPEIQLRMGV